MVDIDSGQRVGPSQGMLDELRLHALTWDSTDAVAAYSQEGSQMKCYFTYWILLTIIVEVAS